MFSFQPRIRDGMLIDQMGALDIPSIPVGEDDEGYNYNVTLRMI